MKSSKKLQISSHVLFVYINNQDRKWRMSVLVFSSALVKPAGIQGKKEKNFKRFYRNTSMITRSLSIKFFDTSALSGCKVPISFPINGSSLAGGPRNHIPVTEQRNSPASLQPHSRYRTRGALSRPPTTTSTFLLPVNGIAHVY